jgi:hypothetical protein
MRWIETLFENKDGATVLGDLQRRALMGVFTTLSLRLHIRQISGREWPSKHFRLMLLLVADDSFNRRQRIVNAAASLK